MSDIYADADMLYKYKLDIYNKQIIVGRYKIFKKTNSKIVVEDQQKTNDSNMRSFITINKSKLNTLGYGDVLWSLEFSSDINELIKKQYIEKLDNEIVSLSTDTTRIIKQKIDEKKKLVGLTVNFEPDYLGD